MDTSLCYAKFSMTNKGRFRPLFSQPKGKLQSQPKSPQKQASQQVQQSTKAHTQKS